MQKLQKKNQLKLQKIIHLFERQNEKILSLQKKVWGGGLPKTPVIWYFQIKEAEFQMKFHHNKPLT